MQPSYLGFPFSAQPTLVLTKFCSCIFPSYVSCQRTSKVVLWMTGEPAGLQGPRLALVL